jgi:hypothetical protein
MLYTVIIKGVRFRGWDKIQIVEAKSSTDAKRRIAKKLKRKYGRAPTMKQMSASRR